MSFKSEMTSLLEMSFQPELAFWPEMAFLAKSDFLARNALLLTVPINELLCLKNAGAQISLFFI